MRDRTFPRHVHVWREFLPSPRDTFVLCEKCDENGVDTVLYLDRRTTTEFRRQVRHGIKPHFDKNKLIGYDWKQKDKKKG